MARYRFNGILSSAWIGDQSISAALNTGWIISRRRKRRRVLLGTRADTSATCPNPQVELLDVASANAGRPSNTRVAEASEVGAARNTFSIVPSENRETAASWGLDGSRSGR